MGSTSTYKTALSYFISFFVIVYAAVLIKGLFFIYCEVPTSSMEGTLLPGDGILVSKLHYGARVNSGTFFLAKVNDTDGYRLPGITTVKAGDVVEFNSPYKPDITLVKRCVALPGDVVKIESTRLYINSYLKQYENSCLEYRLNTKDTLAISKLLDSLGVESRNRTLRKNKSQFILLLNSRQADVLSKAAATEKMYIAEKKGGNGSALYPAAKRREWSRDNYGPLKIPYKGYKLPFSAENLKIYGRYITAEGNLITADSESVNLNGAKASSYVFKSNYYFMMGDNRHRSIDSRWIGLVPENYIIGKAVSVVYSADSASNKLRWERIFKSIK